MIEAKLENVSKMEKVSHLSTYKIVDLTLDQKSNATLYLNTSYGAVFSNLSIEPDLEGGIGCSKSSEKYVLIEGPVAIGLRSTYDNIYVRSF